MSNKIYGGIDPGAKGYISTYVDGKFINTPIPKIGDRVNVRELASVIENIALNANELGKGLHFVIEDVHAVFGSAAGATFAFGKICGLLEGMLIAFKIPYTAVQPKVWQKELWQGVKPVKKPLTEKQKKAGRLNGQVDTKKTSLLAAQKLFPEIDFFVTEKGNKSKNFDDNLVDSVLICEYCKRKF